MIDALELGNMLAKDGTLSAGALRKWEEAARERQTKIVLESREAALGKELAAPPKIRG